MMHNTPTRYMGMNYPHYNLPPTTAEYTGNMSRDGPQPKGSTHPTLGLFRQHALQKRIQSGILASSRGNNTSIHSYPLKHQAYGLSPVSGAGVYFSFSEKTSTPKGSSKWSGGN